MLAEGYGACPTTGYTIEVKELYETEHAVCLHTSLMGPATGEETKEITTFPYIVVEISGTGKKRLCLIEEEQDGNCEESDTSDA